MATDADVEEKLRETILCLLKRQYSRDACEMLRELQAMRSNDKD